MNPYRLLPGQAQVLLVTYDLKTSGWNYTEFYNALKAQGAWWHYLSNSWLIATSSTPDQVYHALASHLPTQDLILVLPVKKPAFGWLPKDAWDWINANVPPA
jgi:hypothetical protein